MKEVKVINYLGSLNQEFAAENGFEYIYTAGPYWLVAAPLDSEPQSGVIYPDIIRGDKDVYMLEEVREFDARYIKTPSVKTASFNGRSNLRIDVYTINIGGSDLPAIAEISNIDGDTFYIRVSDIPELMDIIELASIINDMSDLEVWSNGASADEDGSLCHKPMSDIRIECNERIGKFKIIINNEEVKLFSSWSPNLSLRDLYKILKYILRATKNKSVMTDK